MKTKQEQIEKMAVIGCVRNPQAHTAEECAKCDFKQGQCNAYRHAEALYNAGYRKIDDLKAENKQLKTECALLDGELRIARQETIDVLNKLKTKAFDKDAFNGWAGSTFVVLVRDIDKMIDELTNL